MSDESNPPDLRWLIERIDRNHAETCADMAKLEMQVAAIPAAMDRYVLARVYEAKEETRDAREKAQDERIKQLQDNDTSKATGARNWLYGLAQTAFGVALGLVGAYLTAKGHG